MKTIIMRMTLLVLLLLPVGAIAQTFTCTIQNQTLVGTDFSFDIYIQYTSGADIHLADCDFAFNFNGSQFTSPVASVVKNPVLVGYLFSAEIKDGNIIIVNVTTANGYVDAHVVSSTAPGSKMGTVTISNSNLTGTAGLTWRTGAITYTTVISKYETNNAVTNITGNGTYTNPADHPLPVELSSFTASINKNNISLKWQTKTEVNNYGFEVERKAANNGKEVKSWEKIGFVNGNGNSNSPKDYTLTDKYPTGGSKFVYRLKQIDSDGKYEYSKEVEVELVPNEFNLYQNYPNPFNPSTNIKFALPKTAKVTLLVYNLLGEKVATLLNEDKEAGFYDIQFNASSLSTGMYIYRLTAGDFVQTKKMTLIK